MDFAEWALTYALYGNPGQRCGLCGGMMDVMGLYHILGEGLEGERVVHAGCVAQRADETRREYYAYL